MITAVAAITSLNGYGLSFDTLEIRVTKTRNRVDSMWVSDARTKSASPRRQRGSRTDLVRESRIRAGTNRVSASRFAWRSAWRRYAAYHPGVDKATNRAARVVRFTRTSLAKRYVIDPARTIGKKISTLVPEIPIQTKTPSSI